jgi:asparagine N-glycosylation enzyme membrane subunit Stt3
MYLELTQMAMSILIFGGLLLAVLYGAFDPPLVNRWVRVWIWSAFALAMIRARATVSGASPSWWGVLIWWHLVCATFGLIVSVFASAIVEERRRKMPKIDANGP